MFVSKSASKNVCPPMKSTKEKGKIASHLTPKESEAQNASDQPRCIHDIISGSSKANHSSASKILKKCVLISQATYISTSKHSSLYQIFPEITKDNFQGTGRTLLFVLLLVHENSSTSIVLLSWKSSIQFLTRKSFNLTRKETKL